MILTMVRVSGRMQYLMLFPRMVNCSRLTGSRFFRVILTAVRWVFMAISTPEMVPCT